MGAIEKRYVFDLDQDGKIVASGAGDAKRYVVADDHTCGEDCGCLFSVEDAGVVLHRHAVALMEQSGEKDYGVALHEALPGLPERLRAIYVGLTNVDPDGVDRLWDNARTDMPRTDRMRDVARAGEQLDKLARQWMAETGEDDYETALQEILRRHPALTARYLGRD